MTPSGKFTDTWRKRISSLNLEGLSGDCWDGFQTPHVPGHQQQTLNMHSTLLTFQHNIAILSFRFYILINMNILMQFTHNSEKAFKRRRVQLARAV